MYTYLSLSDWGKGQETSCTQCGHNNQTRAQTIPSTTFRPGIWLMFWQSVMLLPLLVRPQMLQPAIGVNLWPPLFELVI